MQPYSSLIIHTYSNLKILREIEDSLFPLLPHLSTPISLKDFINTIAVTRWYLAFEIKFPDFFLTL